MIACASMSAGSATCVTAPIQEARTRDFDWHRNLNNSYRPSSMGAPTRPQCEALHESVEEVAVRLGGDGLKHVYYTVHGVALGELGAVRPLSHERPTVMVLHSCNPHAASLNLRSCRESFERGGHGRHGATWV